MYQQFLSYKSLVYYSKCLPILILWIYKLKASGGHSLIFKVLLETNQISCETMHSALFAVRNFAMIQLSTGQFVLFLVVLLSHYLCGHFLVGRFVVYLFLLHHPWLPSVSKCILKQLCHSNIHGCQRPVHNIPFAGDELLMVKVCHFASCNHAENTNFHILLNLSQCSHFLVQGKLPSLIFAC